MTWDKNAILEYFDKRFGGSQFSSVQNGIYDALTGTPRSSRGTRYWISIRARAGELLEKRPADVEAGLDYALTEIVRCKSIGELGVPKAVSTCADLYLDSTFQLSNASTFVVIGAHAGKTISQLLSIDPTLRIQGPISIAGTNRMLLFLPHPASRESAKTVSKVLTQDELRSLHSWINTNLPKQPTM